MGGSPSYSGWVGNGGSHALQVDAYVCGDTHFWRRAGTCPRRRSRTSTIGACSSTAVTPGDQYESLIGEMKRASVGRPFSPRSARMCYFLAFLAFFFLAILASYSPKSASRAFV